MSCDLLIENAMLATMNENERNALPYGEIANGGVVRGVIGRVGTRRCGMLILALV